MDRITFRDHNGREGRISEELDVDYGGQWQAEVDACVERIDDRRPPEEVHDRLVIELPEVAPVDGVQQVDPVERAGR